MSISDTARQAKRASIDLAATDTDVKNGALATIADALNRRRKDIINANHADLAQSEHDDLGAPLIKRLRFDDDKIDETIEGIRSLIALPEPVGTTLSATELDDGLELYRVSCPIGVIGVIFESRPDALVQISTLCLKSGNAALIKGGSEAARTNRILADIITEASLKAGIPEGWLQLLETRSDVNDMLKLETMIDLIIPRGSNEFVQYIMANSNIPVLGHADGICHVYVDKDADLDQAVAIATDSKCQYVAVCNAAETLLVHSAVAEEFLPAFKKSVDVHKVELYGCERSCSIIDIHAADDDAWATEYLDYAMSVRIVDSLSEAIGHINTFGSGHTETIVTASKDAAEAFMNLCDSGNVFWNASTRFSDGFRYGLGAEVGISTNKIHARGPVGLDGLLIYKWKLIGKGQIVSDYASGDHSFTHKPLDKDFSI
jgi:glutamate-5-semialdehyde dehydrogenase